MCSREILVSAPDGLTHWGRVTHICVNDLTNIGSDNGLSPARRQAIIWTNAGILLTGPIGTKFSEIFIEIHTSSFKKIHLKMASGKWRLFLLCLNVLTQLWYVSGGYGLYNSPTSWALNSNRKSAVDTMYGLHVKWIQPSNTITGLPLNTANFSNS